MFEMWESGASGKKLYGTESQKNRNNSRGRRRQIRTTGFCRRLVDIGRISESKEKTTQIVFNYNAMIQKISCKQLPGEKKAIFLRKRGNQLSIKVLLKTQDTNQYVEAKALIDSGCTRCAISRSFIKKHQINRTKLDHKIRVVNADGTENKAGRITHHVEMKMRMGEKHWEDMDFGIMELEGHDIFLGYDWLQHHNPEINWKTGAIRFSRCPNICDGLERFRRSNISMDIKISKQLSKKERNWKEIVPGAYHTFPEVFEDKIFENLPEHQIWDHEIEFIEGADFNTVKCPIYPLNKQEEEEMNKFIDENLKMGRIRPSKSQIASPFFFVKKKTADLRPVQDYWNLNKITKKNCYPLPLISELLDKIKNAKWFTKMDVRKGYNNIWMKEGEEWKAAFKTNRGLFEPLVMFFGLCNSPGTFQTFMDHIFSKLKMKGWVVVYMDDILIFSMTLETHQEAIREVLKVLQENKLCVKPDKSEFYQNEVEFLGFIIGHGKIRMDPGKVEAVKDWKSLTTKKELQTFLGFANFY